MKKNVMSTLMWVAAVIVVLLVAKFAYDRYAGSKLEVKHKDGHTKIKYENPETGEKHVSRNY